MTDSPLAAVASIVASVTAFVLAAAETVPTWVGIPTGIAGLSIPLGLFLSRRVVLRSDCDERIAVMQARQDALVADRNAWRAAQEAEVEARVAAQKAAAALLEQSQLSVRLLDALTSALGKSGSHER